MYSVIAMLAASRACAEMAVEKGTMAEERAAMELKIVGKTKSVGDDTSITVGAPLTLVTTTTGTTSVTRGTGEIDKITAMSTAVLAVSEAAVDPSATPPVLAEIIGKPAIDMRSINIGLRLDSADDSARGLRRTGTLAATGTEGVVTQNYVEVTALEGLAKFPTPAAFKHVHYGMWNKLDAKGNTIADLGIGFVNPRADGGGMTGSDMPNVGTATYNGHWVASVQEGDLEGDGTITHQSDDSMMTARFEKNEVTVDMTGLATLDGTITGDRFSGTKVSVVVAGKGRLDATGTFTGGFNGAFFGPKGAEAGGVFDYTSKDMKAGAFRGSFGGAR